MRAAGIDWRIVSLIVIIVLIAFLGVLRSLAVYGSATGMSEISQAREYCEAEEKANPGKRPKECKNLVALTLEDPIALYTFVLTAATVFLVVATCGLWYTAIRQAHDAQEAIFAAKRSADAAAEQVSLGRLSLESTDRAFVVMNPFFAGKVPLNETGGVEHWGFIRVLKNVGRTPARALVSNSNFTIKAFGHPFDPRVDAIDHSLPGRGFLGPGNETGGSSMRISIDDLEMCRLGKCEIYLWGWAEYNDVFATTPRHRTEYCAKLIISKPDDGGDLRFGYMIFGPHNGIDEECYRKPGPYPEQLAS